MNLFVILSCPNINNITNNLNKIAFSFPFSMFFTFLMHSSNTELFAPTRSSCGVKTRSDIKIIFTCRSLGKMWAHCLSNSFAPPSDARDL